MDGGDCQKKSLTPTALTVADSRLLVWGILLKVLMTVPFDLLMENKNFYKVVRRPVNR